MGGEGLPPGRLSDLKKQIEIGRLATITVGESSASRPALFR